MRQSEIKLFQSRLIPARWYCRDRTDCSLLKSAENCGWVTRALEIWKKNREWEWERGEKRRGAWRREREGVREREWEMKEEQGSMKINRTRSPGVTGTHHRFMHVPPPRQLVFVTDSSAITEIWKINSPSRWKHSISASQRERAENCCTEQYSFPSGFSERKNVSPRAFQATRDKFDKFYNKRVFHLFRDVTLFQSYLPYSVSREVRLFCFFFLFFFFFFFFLPRPNVSRDPILVERNILIGNAGGKIGGCTPMGRKDGL